MQLALVPGARLTGSQVPTTVAPGRPSEICTPVKVTLPVFSAVTAYVIVLPATRASDVVFVSTIDGAAVAVMVTASVAATAGPVGGKPTTDAEFVNEPESTSAWVAV